MPRNRKEQTDNYNKAFPTALRKLMDCRKTTQNELAEHLNKTRQAISYYCDGSSSPDWETLVKIADFFNVSTDYILGRTDDPDRAPCAADELGLRPSVITELRKLIDEESGEVLEGINMFLDVAIKDPSIFLLIHYLSEEIKIEKDTKINRQYLSSVLGAHNKEILDVLSDGDFVNKSLTDTLISSAIQMELNEKYPQYRGHIAVLFGNKILEHRLETICSEFRLIVEYATGYLKYMHDIQEE